MCDSERVGLGGDLAADTTPSRAGTLTESPPVADGLAANNTPSRVSLKTNNTHFAVAGGRQHCPGRGSPAGIPRGSRGGDIVTLHPYLGHFL